MNCVPTPPPNGPYLPNGYQAYLGWVGVWETAIPYMDSSQCSLTRQEVFAKQVDAVNSGDFHAGIFLAELPEAVGSVVGLTTSIFKSIHLLAKGDVSGSLRTLSRAASARGHRVKHRSQRLNTSDISSTWLSMQYAWKPLFQDISNLMEKIEKMKEERKLEFRSRGKVVFNRPLRIHFEPGYEQRYRFQAIWNLREHPSMAQILGLTDPLSVIWEKVPLSFVVDWFIPIGNYLKVMGFPPRLVNNYCHSGINTVTSKQTNVDDPPSWIDGSWDIRRYNFARSVGTDPNSIDFYGIPYPPHKTLNKAFSLAHCENAAALIHGGVSSLVDNLSRVDVRGQKLKTWADFNAKRKMSVFLK